MKDLKNIADTLAGMLAERQITKYAITVRESEKQEFNAENGNFSLFRTVFNSQVSLKVFLGTRMGSVSGNDISGEGLKKLAEDAIATADSATEDEAHDIAPKQEKRVFRDGAFEPDMDLFFVRMRELLTLIGTEYPLIRVMLAIADHTKVHSYYRNTNGTEFERFTGAYEAGIEFAANDGEHTTGIDYAGVTFDCLDAPIISRGNIRKHLEDTSASLKVIPLTGKFEGTVIMTPDMVGYFIWMAFSNFISDQVILNGTSLWLNRVGEQVADERLTISLSPSDERIVGGERWTEAGYASEDVALIENGILKSHWLSLYAAKRTGRPVVKNTGESFVMKAGTDSLQDLIRSVKKGLIVGGFSGGEPGANGEFSGVAKNSFLIEDGVIVGAVTETMINGNLEQVFKHIRGITAEVTADGSTVLPYLAADGIVISGK